MGLTESLHVQLLYREACRIRAERGLPPQTLDESACRVAQAWVEYLAETKRIENGYGVQLVAYCSDPDASILACFDKWVNSVRDLPWLLSNELVGYAIHRSPRGTWWTAKFGQSDPASLDNIKDEAIGMLAWIRKIFGG